MCRRMSKAFKDSRGFKYPILLRLGGRVPGVSSLYAFLAFDMIGKRGYSYSKGYTKQGHPRTATSQFLGGDVTFS